MSRSKEKNKELIILRIQRTPLLWRAFACSNPLMINIIISMYRIEKLERLCCALKIHSCVSVFIEHLLRGRQRARCLTHRSRFCHYPHLTEEKTNKDPSGKVIL